MKKEKFIKIILIYLVISFIVLIVLGGLIGYYLDMRLNIYNVGRGSEIRMDVSEPHGRKGEIWEIAFYGKDHYITCDIYDKIQERRYRSLLTKEQIEILNIHLFRTERIRWYWNIIVSIWENQNVIKGDSLVLEETNPSYTVFDRVMYLSNLPMYRVKQGETLSSIALQIFGDTKKVKDILDVNPLMNKQHIQAGMTIRLPQR